MDMPLASTLADEDHHDDAAANGAPGGEQCPCCAAEARDSGFGRHKLWELDPGSHCSIIGTCLSLDDLRWITRKAQLTIAPDAQDYDVHGYFVTRANTRSLVTKLVHKTLDRKYATQLARFRRSCSAAEVAALWHQAMASGDIAGAYWALMTHPATTRAMGVRAHNEVHMLSHLMGKSTRDDIRRLRQLESTCAELTKRLTKTSARATASVQERDASIRALEAQLAAAPRHARPTAPQQDARASAALAKLGGRFATLERRLRAERARARAAEARLVALQESKRRWSPAASSEAVPAPDVDGDLSVPACDDVDLQGRAMLYVGGHPSLAPHLRAQVERRRGRLLYHDGGIEVQNGKLLGLVSQADTVFCPVVCVSHDACLRLKQLCRRQGKPFVLLRSAGLSGFVSALSGVAGDAVASIVVPN